MLGVALGKYFWTAELAVLTAAALIAARTINGLGGAAIRSGPRWTTPPSSDPPVEASEPAALDPDAIYRLIGQQAPAAFDCDDPHAKALNGDGHMRLAGVVLGERLRFSLVTIMDRHTRETRVVAVGEELDGIRLLAVERVRENDDATGNGFRVVATVCTGGRKEYLELGPGAVADGDATDAGRGSASGAADGAYPATLGRQLGPNRYEIERSALGTNIADPRNLAGVRVVPSFRNGVSNGFKLFIQPGALFGTIGFENGDVIQRVNGHRIDSPTEAFAISQKLRDSGYLAVELERAGQTVRNEYIIR
jgi:general secretion pathway protein C